MKNLSTISRTKRMLNTIATKMFLLTWLPFSFMICLAIIIAPVTFNIANAQTQTQFIPGDIYLFSRAIPNNNNQIVEGIHRLQQGGGTSFFAELPGGFGGGAYDPYRDMLIVNTSGVVKGVQPSGDLVTIASPVYPPYLLSARGDGLIYTLNTFTGFLYIDAQGNEHNLADADPRLASGTSRMFYHRETNSLFLGGTAANIYCSGDPNVTCVIKVPLDVTGTKVEGPVSVIEMNISFNPFPGPERPTGLGYGPLLFDPIFQTYKRLLFLVIDTNSNDNESRMITFDPFTMGAASAYTQNGFYIGAAATDAGVYSLGDDLALILDTGNNVIRAFRKDDQNVNNGGLGTIVATGVSGDGCCESAQMVEIEAGSGAPLLIADAGQNQAIYSGQSTTIGGSPTGIGGTPPHTFSWSPTTGLNNSSIANPTASPVVTTTYTVLVTDANGNIATDKVTLTVSSPNCTSPPSGLVSWWPGEDNANDIQSTNHGALQNGATFAAGKVGQAFSLDGVDDFVQVPNNASLNVVDNFTVDAWIFPTAIGPNSSIFSHGISCFIPRGWEIDLSGEAPTTGKLIFDYSFDGNTSSTAFSVATVPLNQWSHVAVTLENDQVTFYINGQQSGSENIGGNLFANFANIRIGGSHCNANDPLSRPFTGLIDEVDFFNRTLTAQEIASIYNAGSAGKCANTPPPVCVNPPAGLVSWWPGNGNTNDIESGINGALINDATFTAGLVGQAFSFDGAGDYVSVPDNTAWDFGMNDFTIDLWVHFNQVKSSLFIHQQNDFGGGFEFLYEAGALIFNRNGFNNAINRAWAPQANSWYHLAVTRTSGAFRFYVNGAQLGSEQYDPNPISDVSGILRIGNYAGSSAYDVNGLLDEISIYHGALTAAEIQSLYNAGSAGKCINTPPPVCVNPPSGLVSWWPGDENANDIQGGNHGTLQNGVTFVSGLVDQAFSFDGVNDYVEIPHNNAFNTTPLTIDLWINVPATHNSLEWIISKNPTVDGFNDPFSIAILPDGVPYFRHDDGIFDGDKDASFVDDIRGQGFKLLTLVRTATTVTTYIDGVQKQQVTYSFTPITNTAPIRMGQWVNQFYFSGLVDEIEIFNRALAASEIQSIYNAGSAGKCKCEVIFNPVGPFCANAAAVDLSGAVSPAGGTFSGPGISGTIFDPAAAGAGTHAITYTFTDANNCTKSTGQNIVVNPLPSVTFNPVGPFLVTDAPVNLANAVSPSGGTFSGPGISGTMFNPATAGVGTHTIAYSFSDGNSCANSANRNITVNAGPPAGKVFVFLANKDVEIDRNGASEGNIHANNDITFKKGSPSTHKGDLSAVDDVTINSNNTIVGNVTAGDRVQRSSGVKVTGVVKEDPGTPVIPLPAPAFTAGGNDVSVPANGTLSLAPGAYDDVTVNKNATLNLRSGNYFIDMLDLKDTAKLTIDVASGAVNVNVVAKLSFGKKVVVSITPSGEAGSNQVTFTQLDKARVTIGESAKVLGGLIAVKAEVRLSKNSRFKGAICAEQIVAEQGVVFLPHGSPTSLPKASEVYESEVTKSDDLRISDYVLEQNYPNPFNPSTVISFQLPVTSEVKLAIYSITGQLVRELTNGEMNAGRHVISWDGRDHSGYTVAAGMYLYRLVARGANGEIVFTQTRRMALVNKVIGSKFRYLTMRSFGPNGNKIFDLPNHVARVCRGNLATFY